ncbi:FecCD family ABC transporter permease [Shinella sp. BYT-45]|uniref:FecCD family ABC transporter permease n=1 Tax=Shinella sp. BYT-45 TaxID=3377377 RepID=UPI00397F6095
MSLAVDRATGIAAYRRRVWQRSLLVSGLAALCVLSFLIDLATGPAGLSLGEVVAALLAAQDADHAASAIVWQVRLPMALMTLLVGAALALAGVEMQTVLANPLAEPFTLGVSSAAALGAALAIVLSIGLPGIPPAWIVSGNAFVFAIGALLVVQGLARLSGAGPETLVLFGIALGFSAGAVLSLIQFIASADALQQLAFWSMGSLARVDWQTCGIMLIVLLAAAPFSLASAWRLTALRLGADRARSFGIDVRRLRLASLVRIGLLAASAVAFVGIIGFVGLVGPHIARMLVGEDHRFLLPSSLLIGALLMSIASILGKVLIPGVLLPIGIVTALVGLPVFILLIVRRGRVAA